MKSLRHRLLPLLAVLWLASTSSAHAQAPPDWAAIEQNIHYDEHSATVLDILYPKAESKELRPGVIMFHGGGWIRSTKETMMSAFCRPYLEQGFVVCNVEYRVAPMATAPAAVVDSLKAAKWFADHLEKYKVDPARVVVTGASAGGHLALMVGMTPESAGFGPAIKIAAIVNGYGPADVQDLLNRRTSWAVEWLPEQPERAELAKKLSPLTYVRKDLPPILTVQGANDNTVPVDQNRRLTKALKDAGVDAEMITIAGASHGFTTQWPDVNRQVFEFLKKRGVLKSAEPTKDKETAKDLPSEKPKDASADKPKDAPQEFRRIRPKKRRGDRPHGSL